MLKAVDENVSVMITEGNQGDRKLFQGDRKGRPYHERFSYALKSPIHFSKYNINTANRRYHV